MIMTLLIVLPSVFNLIEGVMPLIVVAFVKLDITK